MRFGVVSHHVQKRELTERVLEVLENINGEHQQMRNPPTMQSEATVSFIQIDSKLRSEFLREEPTKEATVKMVVQYHECWEQSNH